MRRLLPLCLALALIRPAAAQARARPASSLGMLVTAAGPPAQASLLAVAEWGLLPLLALRAEAGPSFAPGGPYAQLSAGPSLVLDGASWVPRLFVLGSARVPHSRGGLDLGVELERFVSLHGSIRFDVRGQWRSRDSFAAAGGVGVAYSF